MLVGTWAIGAWGRAGLEDNRDVGQSRGRVIRSLRYGAIRLGGGVREWGRMNAA